MIFNIDGGSTAEQIKYDNSKSGLESENVQAAVDELTDSLEEQPQFIYDENGKITGYKTKVGADSVFPFSNRLEFRNETNANGTSAFAVSNTTLDVTNYSTMEWSKVSGSYTTFRIKNEDGVIYENTASTGKIDISQYDEITIVIRTNASSQTISVITDFILY